MRVARAEEGDLPQIVERWKEMMDLHKGLDPLFTRAADGHAAFEAYLRECLSSPDHLLLVAIEGKDIQGYLLAHISDRPPVFERRRFGEISDLAVREDCWRQGIGERMFKGATKWFRSKGIDRVEVRASPRNEAASEFWRKNGFEDLFHVLSRGL